MSRIFWLKLGRPAGRSLLVTTISFGAWFAVLWCFPNFVTSGFGFPCLIGIMVSQIVWHLVELGNLIKRARRRKPVVRQTGGRGSYNGAAQKRATPAAARENCSETIRNVPPGPNNGGARNKSGSLFLISGSSIIGG